MRMRSRCLTVLALFPLAACSGTDEAPEGGAGSNAAGSSGQSAAGSTGAAGGGGQAQGGAGTNAGTAGAAAGPSGGAGQGGGGGVSAGGAGASGAGGAGTDGGGRAGTAGAAGGAGSAGAAGTGGSTPGLESCPEPPAGAPAEAVIALDTENQLRLAMGLECAELVLELVSAAQNHCDYFIANEGSEECEAGSAHSEVEGCPEFTGTGVGDRIRAAGYMERGSYSECMAFSGDPERSTMQFVNSVYHRTPVLDPWMRHLGYGGGEGCDTIDYGTGPMTESGVTAFYPYAGQIDVPTSFDGSREGPEPPEPTSGWPSGYPVTLYAREIEVTSHSIRVDGTEEELEHLWLAEDDETLPEYAKVLYTAAPLEPNTTYRVVIEGTRDGEPLNFDWTFTTGAGGRPR
jgi:hypothetical protein